MKFSKYLMFIMLLCSINNNYVESSQLINIPYVKSSQVINIPQDYYNIIDNHDTLDLYNNRDMANLSKSLNKLHPRTESGSSNNSLDTNMTDKPDELQPIQEQDAHDIMLSPTFNSNSESDDEDINTTNNGTVNKILHHIKKNVYPFIMNNLLKQQKLQDLHEEKLKKMLTNAKNYIQQKKGNVSESFYKYQQIQSNGIKIILSKLSNLADQLFNYQQIQNNSIKTIGSTTANILYKVSNQACTYQKLQSEGISTILSLLGVQLNSIENFLIELDQDSNLDQDSGSEDNNISCENDNNTICEGDCEDVLNNSAIQRKSNYQIEKITELENNNTSSKSVIYL